MKENGGQVSKFMGSKVTHYLKTEDEMSKIKEEYKPQVVDLDWLKSKIGPQSAPSSIFKGKTIVKDLNQERLTDPKFLNKK